MRWVMRLSTGFGLLSVIASSSVPSVPAWADPPGEARDDHPAGADQDVLGGPKVKQSARSATLITRDFDGRIKRLEVPAEEAALELVDLDEATRSEINRILSERAAILDKIVSDNLLQILDVYNATQAGEKEEARRIFAGILEKAGPLRERGKLSDEIKAAMSPETGQAYDRIRKEYWEAIIREDMAAARAASGGAGAAPPKGALQAAIQKETALAIGAEIKRSYERQASARADQLKEFVEALSLTPEQEARVTRILTEDFQMIQGNKTPGKRTPMQGVALVRSIAAELTPEQRENLGKYIRERRAK